MFSGKNVQQNNGQIYNQRSDDHSVVLSNVRQNGESSSEHNDCFSNNGSSETNSERSLELSSSLIDNRLKWLNSVIAFAKETQASSLDLKGKNIKKDEAVSILTSVIDSQINEIDLSNNCLRETMECLTEILVQTKLRKLNVSECRLTNDDFLLLIKVLKDTEITDLDVSYNHIPFDESITEKFICFLLQSRITSLSIENNGFYGKAGAAFIQSLPNTSITCLNLNSTMKWVEPRDVITAFFSILPRTSITDLNLSWNLLTLTELEELGQSLKESKLERLNLSCNGVTDAGVNALVKGLVGSKIIDLNLKCNNILGYNSLGQHLKHTQIKTLNLSHNKIKHDEMFDFPNFLRGSTVSSLYLYRCFLSDEICQKLMESLVRTEINELFVGSNDLKTASILEFSKKLKHTNLVKVNLSFNSLSLEALSILGDSLKKSKLSSITIVESDISDVEDALFESLVNAKLTHISLAYCKLSPVDVLSLGAALQYTTVTHLELEGNNFGDDGLEALVDCLKRTQVVKLNVRENSITDKGAKALAIALKDTDLLYLDLGSNKIKDVGFHCLAEQINSSFVTILDLTNNCSSSELLITINRFLWENRKIVQQLIDCFQQIMPAEKNDTFQFDRSAENTDLRTLLEDYLFLYKTVVERPSSLNVLAQEKSLSLSKRRLRRLMLEEFPRQFATFIARSVEADVAEHVDFLKQVEELGLSQITEFMLLNRPVYVIDENEGILHPYVYKLMHKYKQPIVNSSIEPRGIDKIIKYFTKHIELDGASDIIPLLRQTQRHPWTKRARTMK